MATENGDNRFQIEQLLFGYERGHRLLAGSFRLDPVDEDLLLPLTDVRFTDDATSHMGGAALRKGGRFALFRTWSAGEGSRPGAVWSHVLLVGFADLAVQDNLRPLSQLFRFPSGVLDPYSRPLTIDTWQTNPDPIRDTAIPELLWRLYGEPNSNVLIGGIAPSLAEEIIFGIWTQQWPRLRRSFKFRTGGAPIRSSEVQFDLQLVTEATDPDERDRRLSTNLPHWLACAADDLSTGGNEFRRFLRRFGAEAQGRADFVPLAEIYVRRRSSDWEGAEMAIPSLAEFFPEPERMAKLKYDYAGPASDSATEARRLQALFQDGALSSFDVDALELSSRSATLWQVDRKVAQETLKTIFSERNAEGLRVFVDQSLACLRANEVASLANLDQNLFRQALGERPDVLAAHAFWDALGPAHDGMVLSPVKRTLKTGEPDQAAKVIEALVQSDRGSLLVRLADTSDEALVGGLRWLSQQDELSADQEKWAAVVSEYQDEALDWVASGSPVAWPILSLLAGTIDPVRAAQAVPGETWAPLLAQVVNDDSSNDVAAFLLAVGLFAGGRKERSLVRMTYAQVDLALASGRLDDAAWACLARVLPRGKGGWSRVERLRRTFVDVVLAAKWPKAEVAAALDGNEAAAERIVELLEKRKKTKGIIKRVREFLGA